MKMWVKIGVVGGYILTRSANNLLFVVGAASFTPWALEAWMLADLIALPILAYLAKGQPICTHGGHALHWLATAVLVSGQYVLFSWALLVSDPASFSLARTFSLVLTLILARRANRQQLSAGVGIVLTLLTLRTSFTFAQSASTVAIILGFLVLSITCDLMIDAHKTQSCFTHHVAIMTSINFILEGLGYQLSRNYQPDTPALRDISVWGWGFIVARMLNNSLYYLALRGGLYDVEAFQVSIIPSNILTLIGQSLFLGMSFPYEAIPAILMLFLMVYWYHLASSPRPFPVHEQVDIQPQEPTEVRIWYE